MKRVSCGKESYWPYAIFKGWGEKREFTSKAEPIWDRIRAIKIFEPDELDVFMDVIIKKKGEGSCVNIIIIRDILYF